MTNLGSSQNTQGDHSLSKSKDPVMVRAMEYYITTTLDTTIFVNHHRVSQTPFYEWSLLLDQHLLSKDFAFFVEK